MDEIDVDVEERDAAALALLGSLPDEVLAELMDLVVEGRPVRAAKLAHDASGPDHPLSAAMRAIGMFES